MNRMKVCWGVLLLAGMAAAQTPVEYEIKSYFPEDGVVKIKIGSEVTNRSFASFSAEDRAYITSWLADREFKSSGLSVEIEKSEDKAEIKKLDFSEPRVAFHRGETKNVTYSLIIENRSAAPFKDIELKSRLFVESAVGKNEAKLCFSETKTISLAPGEKQKVSLKPVLIRDELIEVSDQVRAGTVYHGEPTVRNKDRLLGVYLCVSKKDQTGGTIKHEFEDGNIPDEERWVDYRIIAGWPEAK